MTFLTLCYAVTNHFDDQRDEWQPAGDGNAATRLQQIFEKQINRSGDTILPHCTNNARFTIWNDDVDIMAVCLEFSACRHCRNFHLYSADGAGLDAAMAELARQLQLYERGRPLVDILRIKLLAEGQSGSLRVSHALQGEPSRRYAA